MNKEKALKNQGLEFREDILHERGFLITYCSAANTHEIIMGKYPTKERCLEVIQDIIKNIHLKNPTYEMPEK